LRGDEKPKVLGFLWGVFGTGQASRSRNDDYKSTHFETSD